MKDPSTNPERRYHPREESIKTGKIDEETHHVVLLHKPTGLSVEGFGKDQDALFDQLRDELNAKINAGNP